MSMQRRIAVIGAGPKGLYCLERLADELHRSGDDLELEVHIFEPHPYPGAGPVYDPTQPDYLRMNFANGKIDMWSRDSDLTDEQAPSGPTFVDYLAGRGLAASEADYAPRRLVGTYLYEGFGWIVDSLRAVASVSLHHEAVHSIESQGGSFEVNTAVQSLVCDEVLLATGHGSRTSPISAGISPYPVDQPGGVGDIAPGSTVAVRGMGLTAIDVALALTEGRGGRFVSTSMPGKLRYELSGLEASAILPHSRTGRPMVPKPHPVLMPETEAIVAACQKGSRLIDAIGTSGSGSVLAAIVETSASVLHRATGDDNCETLIRYHLDDLLSREPIGPDEIVLEMRAAVEIAFGQRRPGPDWALGVTWRGVYPALVRLVATRDLDDCWPSFAELATEMERVAFGPPAENAARLLALIDAGIVDTGCAADPIIIEAEDGILLRAGTTVRRADVLVNAVLDPPGAAPHPAPLVASLLEGGLARTTVHSAGLDVWADGTCIGVDGKPTAGLAAVGRPTEGSILGNDTLSRSLHDTPALWARATIRRLCLPLKASAA